MLIKLMKSQFVWIISLTLLISACGHKDTAKEKEAVSESSQEKKLPLVPVVKVQRLRLMHHMNLPGQMLAYQDVPIHAKVEGYIQWIGVDRGSIVKKGQKMITIFCPELDEKTKEGAAKLASAISSYEQAKATEQSEKSKLAEAQARLDADSLTLQRLQQAAQTPGAIAQNEIDIQQKTVESDQARVEAIKQEVTAAQNLVVANKHNVQAAHDVLNALKDMTSYLTITAPFNGVITERNVHEGSIVAVDPARAGVPLVRIQQKNILRLVVAVPEDCISGTKIGQQVEFTVPAFVGKKFEGTVARPAYALDNATRTMPVELNVYNEDGQLEPGMFATVKWLATRPYDTLFVPMSAVDTDLKGTFVIRIKNDLTERVQAQKGLPMRDLIEVTGNLDEGDYVALKATNELQTKTHVITKLADQNDMKAAAKHASAGGE